MNTFYTNIKYIKYISNEIGTTEINSLLARLLIGETWLGRHHTTDAYPFNNKRKYLPSTKKSRRSHFLIKVLKASSPQWLDRAIEDWWKSATGKSQISEKDNNSSHVNPPPRKRQFVKKPLAREWELSRQWVRWHTMSIGWFHNVITTLENIFC